MRVIRLPPPMIFAVLHLIAEKRLAAGKLTVIDATNVQKEARKPFLELAKSQNVRWRASQSIRASSLRNPIPYSRQSVKAA